jgi:hypothetical protein
VSYWTRLYHFPLLDNHSYSIFKYFIHFETGNKRFRDIVSLHKDEYAEASKVSKPIVARKIVKAIRNANPPGRFLMRNVYDSKWYDVGDRRAAEKASQALREKSQEEKKSKDDDDRMHVNYMFPSSAPTYFTMQGHQDLTFDTNVQGGLPPLPEADSTFAFSDATLIDQNLSLYSVSPFDSNTNATVHMASIQVSTEIRSPHTEQLYGHQEPSQVQQHPARGHVLGVTDQNGNIVVTEYDILCGRGGATNHHKVQCVSFLLNGTINVFMNQDN